MRKWIVVNIARDIEAHTVTAQEMNISSSDHPVIYFRSNIKGAWEIVAAFPAASFYAYEINSEPKEGV